MKDFRNLVLTFEETLFLAMLRFRKKSPLPDKFKVLYEYGLIEKNYTDKVDEFNAPIPDGTFSLSKDYLRFCSFKRDAFIKDKLPVYISLVALLISIISLYLSLFS